MHHSRASLQTGRKSLQKLHHILKAKCGRKTNEYLNMTITQATSSKQKRRLLFKASITTTIDEEKTHLNPTIHFNNLYTVPNQPV